MEDKLAIDPQMQQFFQAEAQRQKFNKHVHSLTAECWDTCMGTPGQKLDRRTESCIVNCVDRFLDTSNFVVNRLEKEGQSHLANKDTGSSDGFKWQ